MHELLTIEQIRNNLRRTASEKLISLINKKELEQLALKYYGEYDKNGNLMGYRCPYSGVLITDTKDLVLEHIIPVSSKGGTILFNCIPTSSMVNGYDEKGVKGWGDIKGFKVLPKEDGGRDWSHSGINFYGLIMKK